MRHLPQCAPFSEEAATLYAPIDYGYEGWKIAVKAMTEHDNLADAARQCLKGMEEFLANDNHYVLFAGSIEVEYQGTTGPKKEIQRHFPKKFWAELGAE